MSFAQLTPVQATIINNARTHSSNEERKQIKREVFGAAKMRYGIPPDHKLKAETIAGQPDYLVLKDKQGQTYRLAADGLWVGAPRAAQAARRWFPVDMDGGVDDTCAGYDWGDGTDTAPAGHAFTNDGKDFVVDADGCVFVALTADDLL